MKGGIATVPVVALGVSPVASGRDDRTIWFDVWTFVLVGGTPISASATLAILNTR